MSEWLPGLIGLAYAILLAWLLWRNEVETRTRIERQRDRRRRASDRSAR